VTPQDATSCDVDYDDSLGMGGVWESAMITRLYVDNYKCLVNFEYRPARLQLLYGDNGAGKSTVFEVLAQIRQLVTWGGTTAQVFPGASLTAWQTRPEQVFELDLDDEHGPYRYRLVIQHDRQLGRSGIKHELLALGDKTLYEFDGQDVHLYDDDGLAGPVYPGEGSRSAISAIPERPNNQHLCRFRVRLGVVYVFSIDPRKMEVASFLEQAAPDPSLSNFASWYRHLTQDSPEAMQPLFESLGEVITGFSSLKLTSAGETARVLRAAFLAPRSEERVAEPYFLMLNQLSEGQRCLMALYTILHCAVERGRTICIDEPDNFVALRELQPWIESIRDRVEEESSQCLLISHHPELLDRLATQHGAYFRREQFGPARVDNVTWPDDGLRPSEIIARGWEG
jgi:predicted ATPase